VGELIGDRRDPWFQGREAVEALGVRLAVIAGEMEVATRLFAESLEFIERHEPRYAAAWYVSECVPALADAGFADVWSVVDRYRATAESLGLAMLTARYAALQR